MLKKKKKPAKEKVQKIEKSPVKGQMVEISVPESVILSLESSQEPVPNFSNPYI